MQLSAITLEHMRRAIGIYLELAWPLEEKGRPRPILKEMESALELDDLRSFFDTPRSYEKVTGRRYTLRLGNHRYPFMKFVFQEYLLAGEFFFSVDTHDEMVITPDMPDYEGWQEVRRSNARLKSSIESAWAASGLPTHEALRRMMESEALERRSGAGPGPSENARGRLLVADDEADVARGLGAVLEAMGYEVTLAFDGRQALDALMNGPLPDLVVLDFSMPGLSGEQVIQRLRQEQRTRDLSVLLATATNIDPVGMGGANALLRKPYPQELLFRIIEDQLGVEAAGGDS